MTKKEINFYQIDDVITKSLAPLLIKVLEDKKKALIFCDDAKKLKEIDDSLWTFGKVRFIPHVTIHEKDIEEISSWKRQPIVLSDIEENKNDASHLVLINNSSLDFAKKFERVFYFYDEAEGAKIKKFAKSCEGDFAVNSYKKIDGKWVKAGF